MSRREYIEDLTIGSLKKLIANLPDNTPIGGIDHFGDRENCEIMIVQDTNYTNAEYNIKWLAIDYNKGEEPD